MKDITAILIEPEYLGKLALFNYDALFSWRCACVLCLGGVCLGTHWANSSIRCQASSC